MANALLRHQAHGLPKGCSPSDRSAGAHPKKTTSSIQRGCTHTIPAASSSKLSPASDHKLLSMGANPGLAVFSLLPTHSTLCPPLPAQIWKPKLLSADMPGSLLHDVEMLHLLKLIPIQRKGINLRIGLAMSFPVSPQLQQTTRLPWALPVDGDCQIWAQVPADQCRLPVFDCGCGTTSS